MRERKIPVACVQTRAHDRDAFDARFSHVVALVAEAARGGAELVVLPEGTVPAYVLGEAPVDPLQLARAAATFGELAREYATTIVYGSARIVNDRTFNAAIVVGPDGRELGFAAKQFLWHFDRRWFAPGATLEPIDTPVGRLGVLVCADGRIPTIAATLVERGAELLVMPTAWVTSGRDPNALENLQADLLANVRARENGVPFVVANKCGVERESVAYCGKSAIVDASGAFVARGGEREETIVRGDVVARRATHAPVAVRVAMHDAPPDARAARVNRVAFTLATDAADLARLRDIATLADADILLAPDVAREPGAVTIVARADVLVGYAGDDEVRSPRGLVDARRGGCALFVWDAGGDAAWNVAFARTRAAELRAFVIVFDRAADRAYAVDPDGAIVAGTFEGYRLAAFAYDRARTAATLVAPTTDVAAGLAVAEAIRAGGVTAGRDSSER